MKAQHGGRKAGAGEGLPVRACRPCVSPPALAALLQSRACCAALAVAQAILQQLDRPLLCSTAATEVDGNGMPPDAAALLDRYAPAGLSFVVDVGPRLLEGSTVIDCTGPEPVVLRQGKGDTAFLQ